MLNLQVRPGDMVEFELPDGELIRVRLERMDSMHGEHLRFSIAAPAAVKISNTTRPKKPKPETTDRVKPLAKMLRRDGAK